VKSTKNRDILLASRGQPLRLRTLPEPQAQLLPGERYWLTASNEAEALWALQHLLPQSSPETPVGLVYCGSTTDGALAASAAPTLPGGQLTFALERSDLPAALPRLASEFTRAHLDASALVVLVLPIEVCTSAEAPDFRRWWANLRRWQSRYATAIFIIAYGPGDFTHLPGVDALSGQARLFREHGRLRYRSLFWRSNQGLAALRVFFIHRKR
jgi:hypothetical protein